MKSTAAHVLQVALAEVGYQEKRNDHQLEEKTANTGSGNYTKYGKELHLLAPTLMDYPAPWCDAFVDWCFYKAFGEEEAKRLLGGSFNDYTPASANGYKQNGRWHDSDPQPGDQIFFKNSKRICHTGLVYHTDAHYVYTVEGNTSSTTGVISNGGNVCLKKYRKENPNIAGYGRPPYTEESAIPSYSSRRFIKDIQTVLGVKADGISGSETLNKTITVSKSKNRKHPVVKYLQKYLNHLGYFCGTEDGIAGIKFHRAVLAYQKDHGCVQDGELTARKKTWQKLLNYERSISQ